MSKMYDFIELFEINYTDLEYKGGKSVFVVYLSFLGNTRRVAKRIDIAMSNIPKLFRLFGVSNARELVHSVLRCYIDKNKSIKYITPMDYDETDAIPCKEIVMVERW